MISYRFVPISSQKGVLFFETPGNCRLNNAPRLFKAGPFFGKCFELMIHLAAVGVRIIPFGMGQLCACENFRDYAINLVGKRVFCEHLSLED